MVSWRYEEVKFMGKVEKSIGVCGKGLGVIIGDR